MTPRGLFILLRLVTHGWLHVNGSVIRTAEVITHRFMIICSMYASMSASLHRCSAAHVRPSAPTNAVAWSAKKERLSVVSLFALCLLVYAACFCVSVHQSDKVSLRVRMKDPARQTERKRKRQTERERGKKTGSYSCLPVCLHLFLLFLSVCGPHSRRSTLVTVFWWWKWQERWDNVVYLHNSFPQVGLKVPVNLCCVTRGY